MSSQKNQNASENPTCPIIIERYGEFIDELIRLTAGGPPAKELVAAIEDGTVNINAVHLMLIGLAPDSFTEEPPLP